MAKGPARGRPENPLVLAPWKSPVTILRKVSVEQKGQWSELGRMGSEETKPVKITSRELGFEEEECVRTGTTGELGVREFFSLLVGEFEHRKGLLGREKNQRSKKEKR